MSLGNREGGEDEDAEPEELPDWNAVSSLRETGRRDYLCVFRVPFCAFCKKGFFCYMVCASFARKHNEKKVMGIRQKERRMI